MFNNEEKEFLKELKYSPLWARVLNKIAEEKKLPKYKPIKTSDSSVADSEAQFYKWVYESGRLEESERWFNLLTKV